MGTLSGLIPYVNSIRLMEFAEKKESYNDAFVSHPFIILFIFFRIWLYNPRDVLSRHLFYLSYNKLKGFFLRISNYSIIDHEYSKK